MGKLSTKFWPDMKSNLTFSNLNFALICLAGFLFLFDKEISTPVFMQIFGRLHPLVIHFPIVLLMVLGLIEILKKQLNESSYHIITKSILSLTIFSSLVSILAGLYLSKEGGYTTKMLHLHQWFGVGTTLLIYILSLIQNNQVLYRWALGLGILSVFVTGHFGGGLTHGQNYLLQPAIKKAQVNESDPSEIYEQSIQVIFDEKCTKCHGINRQKGGLNLNSFEESLLGGKNGPVWISGDTKNSELIKRISLPQGHEDRMPPKDKSPVSKLEMELLKQWIQHGAMDSLTIYDLGPEDQLGTLFNSYFALKNPNRIQSYQFPAAKNSLIQKLNHSFSSVHPVNVGSNALHASIYVAETFEDSFLKDLLKIQKQLISLSLSNLPIDDEHLEIVGKFDQLEKLKLNNTNISGEGLAKLSNKRLKSLAISQTNMNAASLHKFLNQSKSIIQLYIWNSGLNAQEQQNLQDSFPHVFFEFGYVPGEDEEFVLAPPIIKNKRRILPRGEVIELSSKLEGSIIRYTLDSSDPDSLTGFIYENPLQLNEPAFLKVRSEKLGWSPSDVVERCFFPSGVAPLSKKLLYPPNGKYSGHGVEGLFDENTGDISDFSDRKWVGFKKHDFVVESHFNGEQLGSVLINYGKNLRSYIFPPEKVEVWGGNNKEDVQLLASEKLQIPLQFEPNLEEMIHLKIPRKPYKYLKIVAKPVSRIASWHNGKGEKAWLFVDEIVFYN